MQDSAGSWPLRLPVCCPQGATHVGPLGSKGRGEAGQLCSLQPAGPFTDVNVSVNRASLTPKRRRIFVQFSLEPETQTAHTHTRPALATLSNLLARHPSPLQQSPLPSPRPVLGPHSTAVGSVPNREHTFITACSPAPPIKARGP